MNTAVVALGALTLVIWLYLLLARGLFWIARPRDDDFRLDPADKGDWPAVVAVVPARDEAETVGQTVRSILSQIYPGPLSLVLVDDQSSDGTGDIARRAAQEAGAANRLLVIKGAAPPAGWTGKLWALNQGIEAIAARGARPDYVLLTDADITHAQDSVASLVARARAGNLAMVSLMARLRCESWAERALVPAFVLFFQMLYPFRWVNQPRRKLAAAAGGCVLARLADLRAIGGIGAIRGELIDDCALGAKLKTQGPIWLGLTDRVLSVRRYGTLGEVGRMISRSAFAQLRYSWLLLAGTVAGLALTFLAPPLLALFADGQASWFGWLAWLAMVLAAQPMLRFYGRSPLWGLGLPLVATAYLWFTVDSALQHRRGKGGMWKGRVQAAGASR